MASLRPVKVVKAVVMSASLVGAPVRNRTCINRLSSGRTAIVLQERELVRFHGIEPRTTAMSRRYSASELKAHDWYPRLGSNERLSVRKTDALPLGYGSMMVRAEGIEPPRASPSQSECGASTSFATLASRIEDDTQRMVLTGGLESPRFGLQNRCSPSELRQLEIYKRPGRPRPIEIASLP